MSQTNVLLMLLAHVPETALPMIAGALLAARLGTRRLALQLAWGMACGGTLAMIAFWAYYASHLVGLSVSWLELLGSLAAIGVILHEKRLPPGTLRALAPPFALWALGTTFLVFLGFLHGVTSAPTVMAANRFVPGLPTDNRIPEFFTTWFYHHAHRGVPPVFPGGWLASDRPPLQIGYALAQEPFGWDRFGVGYQVTTVGLQQLWIIGLWALLDAARVRRHTRMIALVAVLLSDLVIVNGFFTWPKLLPGAMLLTAAAVIASPLWDAGRRRISTASLVGALFALAFLGHGSSVFGIIPLVALMLVRGTPGWRWTVLAIATFAAFSLPWSAYQHYGDPPGNRLLKWQLGGNEAISNEGTLRAIEDGYRQAGWGGTLHNKVENYDAMIGGLPMGKMAVSSVNAALSGQWDVALNTMRDLLFFFLFPSLGLLVVVPLLMVLARWRGVAIESREWRFSVTCAWLVLVGSIAWGLILFGSPISGTTIQSDSYAMPILCFAGAAVGLRAVLPRVAMWFLSVSAALMLVLYVPATAPAPGTSYSAIAAVLSAAALAGFVALATIAGGETTPANVGRGTARDADVAGPRPALR